MTSNKEAKIKLQDEINHLHSLYGYDDRWANSKISMLKSYIKDIKLLDDDNINKE